MKAINTNISGSDFNKINNSLLLRGKIILIIIEKSLQPYAY